MSHVLPGRSRSHRAALPLLLKECASPWYHTHTQPSKVRDSLDNNIKDALIKRYGPQAAHAWKSTADIWLLKQSNNPSIFDYTVCHRSNQGGQKIDVGEAQFYFIALNRLRPSIRQHVIQQKLCSLDNLRQRGRIIELSLPRHRLQRFTARSDGTIAAERSPINN